MTYARPEAESQSQDAGQDAPRSTPSREEKILGIIETARAKRPKFKDDRITMSHGAGGKATQSLIEGLFVPAFDSQPLAELGDAGAVEVDGAQLAMTTDTFVVKPIEFPGGTIGELAVNGTVNDLAAAGARPLALSVSLVLEEGLSADDLRLQVEAIAGAARAAAVQIVAGDTKVVERGHADAMYVNTTGIGVRDPRARLSTTALRPGRPRARLRTGGRARHGDHAGPRRVRARGADRVRHVLAVAGGRRADGVGRPAPALHARRHPRRRRDRAQRAGARLRASRCVASEASVPVNPAVAGAAELLGIDPLYVANEGRMVAFVAPEAAEEALSALRAVPGCEEAAEIGEVRTEPPGMVLVETAFGGKRVMDLLAGDPLPRIC